MMNFALVIEKTAYAQSAANASNASNPGKNPHTGAELQKQSSKKEIE